MQKLLVGAFFLLGAASLAACGGGSSVPSGAVSTNSSIGGSPPPGSHSVYFTTNGQNGNFGLQPSVFGFLSLASGTQYPYITITNAPAADVTGLATDAAGNVYAAFASKTSIESEIIEYGAGTAQPVRTIQSDELQTIHAISVTPDGSVFALVNAGKPGCSSVPHLLVFAPGSNGTVAPQRDITGPATRLAGSFLATAADDSAYVAYGDTQGGVILKYAPSADGNAAPSAAINGTNTGLDTLYGLATSGTQVAAITRPSLSQEQSNVVAFPLNANGNVAPANTLSLNDVAFDIAIDATGQTYLYFAGPRTLGVYAPEASGVAAPVGVFTPTLPAFSGCATCGFLGPMAVH